MIQPHTLPVSLPKHPRLQPESRSPRILVIEDDGSLMPILSRAVAGLDPEVVLDWVTNATDARSALHDGKYDAILADFLLADSESGFALRTDSEILQPEARFAMMSALPISLPERSFRLLNKPFSIRECRDFLKDLLRGDDTGS